MDVCAHTCMHCYLFSVNCIWQILCRGGSGLMRWLPVPHGVLPYSAFSWQLVCHTSGPIHPFMPWRACNQLLLFYGMHYVILQDSVVFKMWHTSRTCRILRQQQILA